jgi:peptide/nickel transport system permease protein
MPKAGRCPSTSSTERARLGLDQPMWSQFVRWITDIFVGDLGTSMWTGRPVAYEIGSGWNCRCRSR